MELYLILEKKPAQIVTINVMDVLLQIHNVINVLEIDFKTHLYVVVLMDTLMMENHQIAKNVTIFVNLVLIQLIIVIYVEIIELILLIVFVQTKPMKMEKLYNV